MPLTLKTLYAKTLEAPVDVFGETVTLVFAPWRYSGEMDEMWIRLVEAETDIEVGGPNEQGRRRILDRQQNETVRRHLLTVLVSWDLMDGDEPYPITEEDLVKLPPPFLWSCMVAIGEANQPDPQKAPTSDEP